MFNTNQIEFLNENFVCKWSEEDQKFIHETAARYGKSWEREISPVVKTKFSALNNNIALVTLQLPGVASLANFEIHVYPHCCGLKGINGFSYIANIPESMIHKWMDAIVATIRTLFMKGYTDSIGLTRRFHRLIFNFVQQERHDYNTDLAKTDWPDSDEIKCDYNHFRTWAKKQQAYQVTIFKNENTENLIHTAIVLLNGA